MVAFNAGFSPKQAAAVQLADLVRLNFVGARQAAVIRDLLNSEDGGFYIDAISRLTGVISTMPSTRQQSGKGMESVAYLHYFGGSYDFWMLEKDVGDPADTPDQAQSQSYGVRGFQGKLRYGYVSLPEILASGIEVDLHFTPKKLAELSVGLES